MEKGVWRRFMSGFGKKLLRKSDKNYVLGMKYYGENACDIALNT